MGLPRRDNHSQSAFRNRVPDRPTLGFREHLMDRAYNRVWGRQSGFEIALFAGAGILFEWLKDQRHERERRAMTTGTKT